MSRGRSGSAALPQYLQRGGSLGSWSDAVQWYCAVGGASRHVVHAAVTTNNVGRFLHPISFPQCLSSLQHTQRADWRCPPGQTTAVHHFTTCRSRHAASRETAHRCRFSLDSSTNSQLTGTAPRVWSRKIGSCESQRAGASAPVGRTDV